MVLSCKIKNVRQVHEHAVKILIRRAAKRRRQAVKTIEVGCYFFKICKGSAIYCVKCWRWIQLKHSKSFLERPLLSERERVGSGACSTKRENYL